MAFSGIEDPQDCQVIWTIFAEKKKNVDACRRYLMKGMTDYAYNHRILIDGGIYLEQDTMKAILELHFNPGEGIAYVQSAAKGLSLLCCRSRSNNETEEIKERELALNATEQTRQFEDYVKYVKGTVARQPASNYWDLKQNIATYMALLWVLFGDRHDYFINLNKIHAVMDLPEVQQLRHKFSPKICRRISWAIIDDGRSWGPIFPSVVSGQCLGKCTFLQPNSAGEFPDRMDGTATVGPAPPTNARYGHTGSRGGQCGRSSRGGNHWWQRIWTARRRRRWKPKKTGK
jgi:hypothetical protein